MSQRNFSSFRFLNTCVFLNFVFVVLREKDTKGQWGRPGRARKKEKKWGKRGGRAVAAIQFKSGYNPPRDLHDFYTRIRQVHRAWNHMRCPVTDGTFDCLLRASFYFYSFSFFSFYLFIYHTYVFFYSLFLCVFLS